jgi:hypothetical protein
VTIFCAKLTEKFHSRKFFTAGTIFLHDSGELFIAEVYDPSGAQKFETFAQLIVTSPILRPCLLVKK